MIGKNALVNRIKRHSQMATLFRSAETSQAGSADSSEVVRAAPLASDAPLPVGYVLGRAPSRPATQMQAMPQPSGLPIPPANELQSQPVETGVSDSSGAGKPNAVETFLAAQPKAAEKTPKMDEPTWNRLENIFQRHQQKQAEEMSSPVQAEALTKAPVKGPVQRDLDASPAEPAPMSRQPQNHPPKPAPVEFEANQRQASAPIVQRSAEVPSKDVDSQISHEQDDLREFKAPQSEPAGKSDLPAVQARSANDVIMTSSAGQETQAIQADQIRSPEVKKNQSGAPSGQAETQEGQEAKEIRQPKLIKAEPVDPTAKTVISTPSPAPRSSTDQGERASQNRLARAAESSSKIQRSPEPGDEVQDIEQSYSIETSRVAGEEVSDERLPLEAVWPVERAEQDRIEPDAIPAAPSEIAYDDEKSSQKIPLGRPGPTKEQLVQRFPEPDLTRQREDQPQAVDQQAPAIDELANVLKDVQPGQRTESSIELVPPRSARPAMRPVSSEHIYTKPDSGKERPAESPGIETAITPSSPEPLFTSPEPVKDLSSSGTQIFRALSSDKQPNGAIDQPESFVPTEIGALPADLWQLIGEQPPAARKAEPANTNLVEEAPLEETKSYSPAANNPAAIQRQADESALANNTGPAPSNPPDDKNNPGAADLDELARQVYAEVRRRLTVEWERFRGG